MGKYSFTKEQQEIIDARGSSLLVSASAGSGKTSVMTERIKQFITNKENPVSVSNILCLTFTKKSAEDMREKITQKLEEMPEDDYILNQLLLISTADISDLHSFYSRLIGLYFYEVGIDPGFRILNETELTTLKNSAIDLMFEKLESSGDRIYIEFIDKFQNDRTDKNLKQIIFEISEFLNSLENPEEWVKNSIENSFEEDINENICAKVINHYAGIEVLSFSEEIERFGEYCGDLGYNYLKEYYYSVSSFFKCVSEKNSFTSNAFYIFNTDAPRKPQVKGNEELNEETRNFSTHISNEKSKLKQMFISDDGDKIIADLRKSKEDVISLFKMVKLFNDEFMNLKKQMGGLDFSDLERYVYKILQNDEIAEAVRKKYDYVFVDEFQDINQIQDAIITKLSRDDNLFMVGDVKQSIYGFRLSDPQIFLKKMERFENEPNKKNFKLNTNFRSDAGILNLVNLCFSGVMTKEFGGVDYESQAMLVAGENNKNTSDAANLIYIDLTKGEKEKKKLSGVYSVKNHSIEEQTETKIMEAEAKVVFDELEKIKAKDKDFKLSDACVLVTRRNIRFQEFKSALKKLGVPISPSEKYDLCEQNYIKEILNFERYLVNGNDDFLLFLVLKSRFFKFNDAEIAEIRSISTGISFCDIVFLQKQIKNVNLSQKFENFCKITLKFQELAKMLSIKELTNKIVDEFGIYKLNLLALDGKNMNFEMEKFIQNLPEQNAFEFFSGKENLSISEETLPLPDTLPIMTIHASKGLEFKYVFFVNTSANIIFDSSEVLLSKDLGVGISVFDEKSRTKKPTIVTQAIKLAKNSSTAEEEQRLIYVALTRAKEKLFVICSKKFKELKDNFPRFPKKYSDWFEWIIYKKLENKNVNSGFSFKRYDLGELLINSNESNRQLLLTKPANTKIDKKIFVYPNAVSCKIPLKTSVSKILGEQDFDLGFDDDYEKFENLRQEEFTFSKNSSVSSADRGTIYHKFFQFLDLKNLKNIDDEIKKAKEKLGENASLIDEKKIKTLLKDPFFEEIDENSTVIKEREFIGKISAKTFDKNGVGFAILQGVIDLIVEKNGKLFIVDYKTGKIDENKLKKYKFQIETYAEQASNGFNMPVSKKLIALVDEGKLIEI